MPTAKAPPAVPGFKHYQPAHRRRLRALAREPAWQVFMERPAILEGWRATTRPAPAAPPQLAGALGYLRDRNGERVRRMIHQGECDEEVLVRALGDWEAALANGQPVPILFLGLVLTLDCSFQPRCLYCNQTWLPQRLQVEDWKAVLAEAADPVPPYVYLTGGEPLMLGEEIWGDQGLVDVAAGLGCAVNINTSAALITPRVALQLVKAGLAKLHISLDSADPEVQGELFRRPERVQKVLRGIYHVQVAREILGAHYPQIHINCVLTRRNLFQFPDLLRFLLEIRRVRSEGGEGDITQDPLWHDFAFHLIPVGGKDNAYLRPTAEEWARFHTETWEEADRVWQEYQASVGVPEGKRSALAAHVPYASPWLRADHHMSLEEYCERAARGSYWQGALGERCHVAPSQAFVLPDGSQHWCGAHAIQRPRPLGNVREVGLRANICRNRHRVSSLPNRFCSGCAGATCVINQSMERQLRAQVKEWLESSDQGSGIGKAKSDGDAVDSVPSPQSSSLSEGEERR